jgi:TatD DNase family protein
MDLIDTHCHLTALRHKSADDALAVAAAQNVTRVICVGSVEGTKSAHEAVALAQTHPNVWAAVGIHPHDAGSYTSVEEIAGHAKHPKVVALGETGLDFYRDWSPRDKQQILFENTIALAKECGKPLIIHCREALEETLATLIRCHAEEVGGVFHCYSGDAAFAVKLHELNFLVSFPGSITFKQAGAIREAAAKIPLSQIMLETDCPYMAPEPLRGKPSEPAHVYHIAKKLAEVRGLTIEEIAKATTENAVRLFRLA